MAQRRPLKTVADASRDLISELPVEVMDRILECLPTRDAARTAQLSRHWNNVWLQHGRLAFDWEFLLTVQECQDDYGRALMNIINNILFSRAWPVKKFTLQISCADPKPRQYDVDRWCRFLSTNGVEEQNISLYKYLEPKYQLPFCLLSCSIIKQLIVQGPFIDFPVNACDIFSNVTSLAFLHVEFKHSVDGIASSISIPKLEKLAFEHCIGISEFEISPPKLAILSVIGSMYGLVEWTRWLAPHLKTIKSLWLCGSSLSCMDASTFPIAINLQVMKLYDLNFGCWKQLAFVMQLLTKCPNLCELHVMVNKGWEDDDKKAASRLLEDPDGCLAIQELKIQMLNTIQIESFNGSAFEMFFMKLLLSKFPALERVVIMKRWDMNASKVRKIQRKLECFPRVSPNAQIVCPDNYYEPMHKDWLDTHGFRLIHPY
ncbi:PREDICTED: F-box/FBD/LRR-repeat protein At1g13570-like [Ipomoea nil]|uniref:F-box/FBD/LRR-repeat protein At1g13570-like n=1 Tax=Ipomoea nil TaxID=35883 RepID=UPI0009010942|nr:PREDICTED: F-box/FBD/LRR-repeat protein At1g13570-like [Ipomoea nil]